ncbi:zinc finger and BTB domain-containing protein 10 [Oryzias melastigma]|uniref:zinc finger and BTB domain-containing protein 10 n=1 Tax=Oryzias melastigma TaxID=30732 RepID=UPI000CF7CE79|nr:zinc finger and BTB domain-containing protein 10 [Oryzias melastigma]
MSGERNRRSLAFRGGGLAGLTASSGVGGGNCNNWEAPACQDRHFNGNRLDPEEDRDLGASGPSQKRAEGAGFVSDSMEPEEEEDPEGSSWPAGASEDRADSVDEENGSREGSSWTPGESPTNNGGVQGLGSVAKGDETGSRKSGVEMKPQMLLQKPSLFHASWLHEFPWLKFCQETGLMSCSWCHNIATKNNDELVKGTRNYKRALLLRHHLSSEHGRNDPTRQETARPSDNTCLSTNCSEDYRNKPNENSYCYQLLQELDKQRKSGILCDVNIVVSGQVFRAHKNILVAGSGYFKTLYCLTKSEAQDQATVTHLDVAAVQGFSVILDFLYSGNLLLTSQNAIEVMSVASYLQMTDVVQSCRAFINDALNISIKQEAPDTVVVDYNKRQTVAKERHKGLDRKPINFWATSILSKLSIKASSNQGMEENEENGTVKEETSDVEVGMASGEGCALVTHGASGNWTHHYNNWFDSAETNETRAASGQSQVFVWNEPATAAAAAIKREAPDAAAGSGRRKKQTTTRRFVYNFPPEPEEGFDEGMFIQPSASLLSEDFSSLSENAELANKIQYSIIQDFKQESWENGESSHLTLNKLKCPQCNYIAKHRRTLKRHLIIHSGVRSFSCDICGKLFTRREHVKRHSLVHKKDKKYKCMVCKKIFMLAASVGIRHGSRRYGVCADCADSHQVTQVGLEGMEFPRDEDFDGEEGEDIEGEEPTENDQSNCGEGTAASETEELRQA